MSTSSDTIDNANPNIKSEKKPAKSSKKKMSTTKKSKMKYFLGFMSFLLLIGLGTLSYYLQNQQLTRLHNELRDANQLQMEQLHQQKEELEKIKQNLFQLMDDGNEVRKVLHLPIQEYPLFAKSDAVTTTKQESTNYQRSMHDLTQYLPHDTMLDAYHDSESALFFKGIEYLLDSNERVNSRQLFDECKQSDLVRQFLWQQGMHVEDKDALTTYVKRGNNCFYTLRYDLDSKELYMEPTKGEETIIVLDDPAKYEEVVSFFNATFPAIDTHFSTLWEDINHFKSLTWDNELRQLMQQKSLYFLPMQETTHQYMLACKNWSNEELSIDSLYLDKQSKAYLIGSHVFTDFETFRTHIYEMFEKLDTRPPLQKKIEEAKKKIEQMFEDETFLLALEENHLHTGQAINQHEFINYYIVNSANEAVGSYSILKTSGEIYLRGKGKELLGSLQSLSQSESEGAEKKN